MLQYFDFYERLLMKAPLVADHLHSSQHLVLVIAALEHLAEAALAQYPQHLVPICKLVVIHHVVITSLIIVTCHKQLF